MKNIITKKSQYHNYPDTGSGPYTDGDSNQVDFLIKSPDKLKKNKKKKIYQLGIEIPTFEIEKDYL